MILPFGDKKPIISPNAFIASNATVIGDVSMGDGSSILFGAVARGDVNSITIGSNTNIQDLCVLHVDDAYSLSIGSNVTVGHRAILHGCQISDGVLVGMGAIVMNGAKVGKNCIIGAGSLVTERTEIPEGSLVIGVPAKIKRNVTKDEVRIIMDSAKHYAEKAREYTGARN